MKGNFKKIIDFVGDRYAMDISMYEESFLEKAIGNRLTVSSRKTLDEYLSLLSEQPEEAVCLVTSLKNSYSQFFRNPHTFALLEQIIFPILFREKGNSQGSGIRIWSAGCSAGQESYSLAILADTYLQTHQLTQSFRIFASDSSVKEIELARHGVYDFNSIQNTRLFHLNNNFSKTGESYLINDRLKKNVDFSVYDLLDSGSAAPPASIYGGFDMIVCSNVLYYYKPDYQKTILNKFSTTLNEGGFLITGEAETAIVKSVKGYRQFTSLAPVFVKV